MAISALVGLAAVGLFSYGVFGHGLDVKVRVFALVAGVLLMFVGVAMVASRVVRPLAYVLGAPGARFGGTAGSLARQNAVRNPARTASTAAAVMIGPAATSFFRRESNALHFGRRQSGQLLASLGDRLDH